MFKVMLAHEMAFASPYITSFAVEATEFPDLAHKSGPIFQAVLVPSYQR